MIVTIWRHGEAGSAVSDRLRELTGQGMDDVGFGCHRFHEICEKRDIGHPELILHSEWVRTTQTADIIANAFTHARIMRLGAVVPGNTPADVDRALEPVITAEEAPTHILLVSHQPLVSRLVDHYLADAGAVPLLSPGGLVMLDLSAPQRGCGRLLFWALPPQYEAGA